MKKKRKTGWIIVIVIVALLVLQTLPVFFPRPLGSVEMADDRIRLYYQPGDEKGAKEVFDLLNQKSEEIYQQMGMQEVTPTNVYLYKTQWQLAIREAGFATLHELVHSIVFRINPELNYFWDNGLATYLSGQTPEAGELDAMPAPTITQMHTDNGLEFANMGGYAFSYSYIDYLDQTYGWDKVAAYAAGKGDYEAIFGATESEIYDAWCDYLGK